MADNSAVVLPSLPNSIEAEQNVLCCILRNASIQLDIISELEPEDFYQTNHRIIFDAMKEIARKTHKVDNEYRSNTVSFATVVDALRRNGKLQQVGDVEYITSAGDYGEDPGAVFSYNPASGEISLIHGQSVSNWCLSGNIIYTQSVTYDESWNAGTSFGTIKDAVFSDSDFLELEGISLKSCYGLAANPETGELVVCDAGDYTAEGSVYYFNADGSLSWSHAAGVCPSKVCWVYSE